MSDNPDTYMPLILGSFLKHIGRLSDAEVGSYILILVDYWVCGAPPDDNVILARLARCDMQTWLEDRRAKLVPFFTIVNGAWRQKRVEEELELARSRKNKAKGAAIAKWRVANDAPSTPPRNARSKPRAMPRVMPQSDPSICPSDAPHPHPLKGGDIESPPLKGRDPDRSPLGSGDRATLTKEEREARGAELRSIAAGLRKPKV